MGLVVGQGLGVPDVVRSLANETLGDDWLAVFVVETLAVENSLTVRIEEGKGSNEESASTRERNLLPAAVEVVGDWPVRARTRASVARSVAHHAFSAASRMSSSFIRSRAEEYIRRASAKISSGLVSVVVIGFLLWAYCIARWYGAAHTEP